MVIPAVAHPATIGLVAPPLHSRRAYARHHGPERASRAAVIRSVHRLPLSRNLDHDRHHRTARRRWRRPAPARMQGHSEVHASSAGTGFRGPRRRGQRPRAGRCCAACSRSSTTDGWPAPATCRSCRSTRASSTRAGASFAPNPIYFDPENIVKLAIEGGCNAVASTLGVLGVVCAQVRAQDPVHPQDQPQRVPDLPRTSTTRSCSRSVEQAFDMGAVAVGATIYFGSDESQPADRGGQRGVRARARARHGHRPVVLPAQPGVQDRTKDYHVSADLTGQANHLGVTHRGRHHQAEAAREQRRLQGARLEGTFGKTRQAHVHRARRPTTRST